jgi:hypothetical protein
MRTKHALVHHEIRLKIAVFMRFEMRRGGAAPMRVGDHHPVSVGKNETHRWSAVAHVVTLRACACLYPQIPASKWPRPSRFRNSSCSSIAFGRFSPVLSGVFGGGAMVAVVDTLMARRAVAGIAMFLVLASLLSGAFATLTQRLRKIAPFLFWTALFFGAVWILGDAVLIAKFPGIGARLPFLPLLAGAEIFAAISCFQLPLRSDRGVIEVTERPRDSFA